MNMQETMLAITALSGETSLAAMEQILPSKRYRYSITEQLQAANMIRPYTKDKVKGYRLTNHAKRVLCETAPQRYESALQGHTHTNHVPSELPRRLRLHRISETLAMMLRCGVPIFPDEKVNLFKTGTIVPVSVPLPAFYLSKEIHAIGDLSIKIKNARMTGVLLAEREYFLVYNTGAGVMRWTPESENRTMTFLSQHFRNEIRWNQYSDQYANAVMLGADMSVAEQLLTSLGGFHHLYFDLRDNLFEHFHFLPTTPDGCTVLQLLLNSQARAALNADLQNAFGPKTLGQNFDYDATSGSDTAVLFCWDFDMIRLKNFYEGILSRGLSGLVMAFDFQQETLEHYLGDAATVHPMSLEKTRRWLLAPEQ